MFFVTWSSGFFFNVFLFSLFFHAGQAAIKPPSAEASKRGQCTSPGK